MKNATLSPSQLDAYHAIASAYTSQDKPKKASKVKKSVTFVALAVITAIGILCMSALLYFAGDKQAGAWDNTHCDANGHRVSVQIPDRYNGDYDAYMKDHGQAVSNGGYCGY